MYLTNEIEAERAAAWADIKESQRAGNVLTAKAIGIEYFELGELKQECLKLNYNGIYGYLPTSFIDTYEFRGIQNFVGKTFEFVVSYVSFEDQIFAANRIMALEKSAKRLWKNGKPGDIYPAFVRGVDRYHVYLLVSGVPTRMHRDEFSYVFSDDLREEIFIGETIDVKVLEINKPNPDLAIEGDEPTAEEKRAIEGNISVSKKALEVDPMSFINEYKEKSTYLGTITKIHVDHGIFISLEPRGITVRSGFPPGSNGARLQVGDEVNFKIQDINVKERRIKGLIITPNQNYKNKSNRSYQYGR